MEIKGFPINEQKFHATREKSKNLLRNLEQKIYSLNNRKFNLADPKEVGKVVGIHKNQVISNVKKSGSTSKQVLEKLTVPIAGLIMVHRKLTTTISNMEALIGHIKNGRTFGNSFCFTQTGRISMNDPNLQNVTKDFVVEFEGEFD